MDALEVLMNEPVNRNAPPFPDFPEQEYVGRVNRLVCQMDQHDVDAVFLTQPDTVPYFSGHQTSIWPSKNYVITCLVTRDGKVIMVVPSGEEGNAIQTAWVDEIRVWGRASDQDGPQALPQALGQVLRDHGLRGGRIGAEIGPAQRINLPIVLWDEVREALAPATFVDASPLLAQVTLVKSSLELERMRKAATCTCAGIRAGLEALRPGISEREVAQAVYVGMMQAGATTPGVFQVRAGRDRFRAQNCMPSDYRLQSGDLVFFDGGATYRGYFCDMARLGTVGSLTPQQAKMARVVLEANQAAREAVRPGAPIAGIYRQAFEVFERTGYADYVIIRSFGHSLGTSIHEAPRLGPTTPGILEPGMVFSVEPGLHDWKKWELGVFLIEDVVAVTEEGQEVLTPLDREVWIAH
jgi:Xaa-Pro dipeptidase